MGANSERDIAKKELQAKKEQVSELEIKLEAKIREFEVKVTEYDSLLDTAVRRSKEETKANLLKYQSQMFDYDRVKSQNVTKQQMIEDLQVEIEKMKSNNAANDDEKKSRMRNEMQLLAQRVKEKDIELIRAQKLLTDTTRELEVAERSLTSKDDNFSLVKNKMKALADQVKEKEGELDQAANEIDETTQKLTKYEAKVSVQEKKIKSLTAELEKTEK